MVYPAPAPQNTAPTETAAAGPVFIPSEVVVLMPENPAVAVTPKREVDRGLAVRITI